MNAFDYFFENTSDLEKLFLAGKEEILIKNLYRSSLSLASWLEKEVGQNKHIILLSVNNLFFLKLIWRLSNQAISASRLILLSKRKISITLRSDKSCTDISYQRY